MISGLAITQASNAAVAFQAQDSQKVALARITLQQSQTSEQMIQQTLAEMDMLD